MRIIRAMNPKVIDMLREHMIADRDYPTDEQTYDLKEYMKSYPDSFLALTLWDEKSEIKGFILAYIPPARRHLFVIQAWADNTTYGTEYPHEMFLKMRDFAEDNDLLEIRAETIRSPQPFLKRWGFEVYSTVLAYQLEQEV